MAASSRLEHNVRELLEWIGENPNREGLVETPKRYLKALEFWTKGYKEDPKAILKEFEDGGERYDAMVFQGGIQFSSHCEHHLTPFLGTVSIGYIPNGKIVGLSKLGRIVEVYARRLQVQERMTTQIANALDEHLQPLGVGVVVKARHLCIETRGVQKIGSVTTTSALRGCIKDEPDCRSEFLQFVDSVPHEIL